MGGIEKKIHKRYDFLPCVLGRSYLDMLPFRQHEEIYKYPWIEKQKKDRRGRRQIPIQI